MSSLPHRAPNSALPDDDRRDFIRDMVADDVASNRFGRPIATRFPPEPNGFPHIGHVKSIALNFGIAAEFNGRCNLRFDDTNPATEDIKYVEAIKSDIEWLGFEWDAELYASDYFEKLYGFAELLVEKGKAYVDSQSGARRFARLAARSRRRARTARTANARSIENLELLRRMRAGEFPDGAHVLRAKIDMAHPNMIMRDPLLLRIRHAHHYRQGDNWCIYPLYDFAHPLSDAIEGITHSLCTLEFKDSNDIYQWLMRETRVRASARADRVLAPGARLHGVEQTKAAAAGERESRPRLGRSAHADDCRHAASRRHARRADQRSPKRPACRGSRRAPSWRRSSTPSATT